MRYRFPTVILSLGLSALIGWQAAAQGNPTCPALVEQALDEVGNNCSALDQNSACYGFNRVESTFVEAVPEDFFTQPSDQTGLTLVQSIQTTPLNLDTGDWGIAVMNVQANVPNTLPGAAVTFLVMGDAQVENRVDPATAVLPATPVTVTTTFTTVARSSPGNNSNAVNDIPRGTELLTDAQDRTGEWLRILVNERPAWVLRDIVDAPDDVDDLPVISATSRSPMQAFYFSTGTGQPTCNEAPDVVTVRSRENISVDLSVNGLDVRIGSTITFQNITDHEIAITAIQGHMELVTGEIINEGETLTAMTDDDNSIIQILDVAPSDETQRMVGDAAQFVLNSFLPPQQTVEEETPETPGEIIHIVVAGETLFGIAQLYDASMPAIVSRNNLNANGAIFVGQRLVIPNPGSGFVGLPTTGGTGTTGGGSSSGVVDCSGFAPTSPLDGLAYGDNTFYWNAASGVDNYRVVVINTREGKVVSFETAGTETMVTGTLIQNTIGGGFDFSWRVEALVAGQIVCQTNTQFLQRAASGPVTVTNPLVFSISGSCVSIDFVATWTGADPTDTVTFTVMQNGIGPFTVSGGMGASGTALPFPNMGSTITNINASASPSGKTAFDPGPYSC
jgi:LysM repeat protein